MSNTAIVKRNLLDKAIVAVHSVIFKPTTNSFWSGGMRSEPIVVGKVSFYYRVNKDATASFMIMFSLNSIKTIEKVPLSGVSSLLCAFKMDKPRPKLILFFACRR